MNKLLSIFGLLFPTFVFASDGSSLSFSPPPGDYSIVFLGNIFGVVDGVLHGSGSQIMGAMFGVFNSAVLALGGIIIMYTLLVSTMNTAHEGQMLGQKWSSIWVPIRSTFGLALLIPKASGYCLMQIFVMWIVVQGVGAADKVWAAALSYLNRGGVIVQSQINPAKSFSADSNSVAKGASTILAGQVCMVGLQTILENQREMYLKQKESGGAACGESTTGSMAEFCNTAVPDFLSTVNAVTVQNNANPGSTSYSVKMPNFPSSSMYATLNGICGTLSWNAYSSNDLATVQNNIPSISSSEMNTAKMSRAIAIQQMYIDLSATAQVMVNNATFLKTQQQASSASQQPMSNVAVQQFGVPFLSSGSPCTGFDPNCVMWGQDPASSSAPLFAGTEFQGAITDYNGIMMPTLNLVNQAKNDESASDQRKFIEKANSQGWILAGSYFFDLARLSAASLTSADATDTNSGLDSSSFDPNTLIKPFGDNQCSGSYADLCIWMGQTDELLNNLISLINGTNVASSGGGATSPLNAPSFSATETKAISGLQSSTVYGFVTNSSIVTLPGQPGMAPPQFVMKFNTNLEPGFLYLPEKDFPCGPKIMFVCIGEMLGDIFYNWIFRTIFNFFLDLVWQLIGTVVMLFFSLPLLGMAQIFQAGVSVIQQPNVNPVVALANMGVNYINFANELWIILVAVSVMGSLIPWFGVFVFAIIFLALPLLITWLGIMVGIGFLTAYYIPFMPYMIFTFGSIAWLMAVIEAMVAAPIVALGITHPEGHEAFGKGEHAIMILMNVFLRPSMMIIGYIAGIALSYVAIWVINAGFSNAMLFVQGDPEGSHYSFSADYTDSVTYGYSAEDQAISSDYQGADTVGDRAGEINTTTGYSGWAGIYGFFFSILVYTTMYLIVVQKAFSLITALPDKVLRWIGGAQESYGQDASQWGEEAKGKVDDAGKKTAQAAQQIDSKLSAYAGKGIEKLTGSKGSTSISGKGGGGSDAGEATPSIAPPE